MTNDVTTNQTTVTTPTVARSFQPGVPKVAPKPEPSSVQEQKPVQQATAEDLEAIVSRLSDFAQSVQRNLSFQVDSSSGRTIITVSDRETEQIVRQIPSEEFLELAENLQDLQGKLLKTSA